MFLKDTQIYISKDIPPKILKDTPRRSLKLELKKKRTCGCAGILADLQGPKLRVGTRDTPREIRIHARGLSRAFSPLCIKLPFRRSFEQDKVLLVEGQKFRFDLDDEPGDATRVKLPWDSPRPFVARESRFEFL